MTKHHTKTIVLPCPLPNEPLVGPAALDAWAQRVDFPIKHLSQRLRNLRSKGTGPAFVRFGGARNAPPVYNSHDIWNWFYGGQR